MILNHLKTPDINKGTGNEKKLFLRISGITRFSCQKRYRNQKWRPRAMLDRHFLINEKGLF